MSTMAVVSLTFFLLALLAAAPPSLEEKGYRLLFALLLALPSLELKGSSSSLAIYSVTTAQWAAFNSSIGGRLGAGRPINMPCFSNYNGTVSTPDMAACDGAETKKADSNFIADHFGGYEYASSS
jgi:hypothetical protein